MGGKASVEIINLGCPKNLVDGERMAAKLRAGGYKLVQAQGEIILINTCSFISSARDEARLTIREALGRKRRGDARQVAVAGCMVESHPGELEGELAGIDCLISLDDIDDCAEILAGARPRGKKEALRPIAGERELLTRAHIAYLKVSEGCDNHCSYCLIPSIRGPYRSRPLGEVVQEAENLVSGGVVELVLVAEDTSRYGDDLNPQSSLAELLDRLNALEGLRWIRLLYLSPYSISDELLNAIATLPRVLPYMDIPIQHTQDNILRDMNRKPLPQPIDELIKGFRRAVPTLCLRTTLMVGFPTESEKDFTALLHNVRSGLFDHIGVFSFSPEAGTPAYEIVHLPKRVVQKRVVFILMAQERTVFAKYRRMQGKVIEAIVDDTSVDRPPYSLPAGTARGRADFQAPDIDGVTWLTPPKGVFLKEGDIVKARLTSFRGFDLLAEVLR